MKTALRFLSPGVPASLALSLALPVAAGCGGGSTDAGFSGKTTVQAARRPDGTIDDRGRCEHANRPDRESTETAGPGSLQPNVRRVWQLVGTGENRTKVLVCREIDTNFDGIKDVVRRYNAKGESLHEESDTNYDGRIDTWLTFSKGRLAEVRLDTNHDGKPDEWKFYVEGKLARARRDTNHDSRADVWEIYREGKLERMGVDVDGDEHVDRWDYDAEIRRAAEAEERRKEEAAAAANEAARKAGEYQTADPDEEGAADDKDAPPEKKK